MNRAGRRGRGINELPSSSRGRGQPLQADRRAPPMYGRQTASHARRDYEDDYGYAGKRPIDELDPMGVKRQRTSSVQMMNMMIQDSQRELANLTFKSTPRSLGGGDHLSQVLNRQQMLLEMQSEMIADLSGLSGGNSAKVEPPAYPKPTARPSEREYEYDEPYMEAPVRRPGYVQDYGYQKAPPARRFEGSGGQRGGRGQRNNIARRPENRRGAGGHGMRGRGRFHPQMRDRYDGYGMEEDTPAYDYNPYLDYEYEAPGSSQGPAMEYYISIEGKLNNFIKCLFEFDNLTMPIKAIETARHENADFVKIRTDFKVVEDMDRDPYIDGHLRMNGVVIARKEGYSKHQVKEEVYAQALYHLLSKSVSEIFAISNRLYKQLPEKAKVDDKGKERRDHRFIISRLKNLIHILQENLPVSYGRDGQENIVHEVDIACGESDAGITLVTKKDGDAFVCELYADDIMIASGGEALKRGAVKNAYRNAKRFLMRRKINVEQFVRESPRLQDVNMADPAVYEVLYKGKNHERWNNLHTWKHHHPDTFVDDLKTKRDVVVLDSSDDPNSNALKILEETASTNCMLLDCVTFASSKSAPARCIFFLQGELIGDSKGFNKFKAKSNAAAKAVYYLRQNYALVQLKPYDFESSISMEKIEDLARDLKAEKPDLHENWQPCVYKFEKPKSEDEKKKEAEPGELSPWVDEVLERTVAEFSETDSLNELIFSSDLPKFHTYRLKELMEKYPINVIFRKNPADTKDDKDDKKTKGSYTIVQKSFLKTNDQTEVVEKLKSLNGESGRYKLVQYKDQNNAIVKC